MKSKIYRWQQELMDVITDPKELLTFLELDDSLLTAGLKAAKLFPFKVPRSFAKRMQKRNPYDPLLLQVLPLKEELQTSITYVQDPLHETAKNPLPGLLHKYPHRVLWTVTGTCAINCRYCFRRFFPYEKNNSGLEGREDIFNYIANDSNIAEVILSGGDPLLANDLTLKSIIDRLAQIPHVNYLRIHSRLPIVLPSRVTDSLIDAMTQSRLKTIMAVHCNHPQEINEEVKKAIALLQKNNIVLLNQSVLLKNINDQVKILKNLSEILFGMGVQPYYLHLLDKVTGTAHFDMPFEEACQLYQSLTEQLPGYLVPRLVYEQPGKLAKTIIGTTAIPADKDGLGSAGIPD